MKKLKTVMKIKNFLSSIGLLSIKPKIIVCNVDEENLSKGNNIPNKYKINTLMKKFSLFVQI